MGYRSAVTVAFYTRDPDVLLPFSALKLWFDENYPHTQARAEWDAEIKEGDDWIMVRYEGVKWYPNYTHPSEVDFAIHKFVDTFDADNKDTAAYEFVRIGEEINDISEHRSDWADYRLVVSREVHFA